MKENMGRLMLDIGKLVVGGIIIGGILRSEIHQVILIISGIVGASMLFLYGLLWTEKEKKEEKENV